MATRRLTTAFPRMSVSCERIFLGLLCALALSPARASGQVSAARQESPLQPYVDADAYRVYAVLLDNAKYSPFVIQSETESFSGITPKNIGIKGNRKFWKVWGAAVESLARNYGQQVLLTRNFPTEAPYELLPNRELRARAEPGTGYYSFSTVGFDPGKKHANREHELHLLRVVRARQLSFPRKDQREMARSLGRRRGRELGCVINRDGMRLSRQSGV